MSMSTHVIGFMEPDEEFKKMYAVYESCSKANVPIPDEVDKFFEYDVPDPAGMRVEDLPVTEYSDDMQEGYQIRVADIPSKVNVIRFFNSY